MSGLLLFVITIILIAIFWQVFLGLFCVVCSFGAIIFIGVSFTPASQIPFIHFCVGTVFGLLSCGSGALLYYICD